MSEKKTKCEELYTEYKSLLEKTNVQVQGSGAISAARIPDAKDFLRKEEIRQELLDCRDSLDLSGEEWFEIENG